MPDQSAVRMSALTRMIGGPLHAHGVELIRLWMRTRSVKLLPDTRRNRRELGQLKTQMLRIAYGAPLRPLLEAPRT